MSCRGYTSFRSSTPTMSASNNGVPSGAKAPTEIPMSKLAKKITKAKSSHNPTVDARASFDHDAMVTVVNYLEHCPQLKQDTANWVRKAYAEHIRTKEVGSDANECSTMDGYNHTWKASYVASKLDISVALLGRAKVHDAKIVHDLYRCLMKSSGQVRIPDACGDPEIMAASSDTRLQSTGDRVEMLTEPLHVIGSDGKISYNTGVYGGEFNDEASAYVFFTARQGILLMWMWHTPLPRSGPSRILSTT